MFSEIDAMISIRAILTTCPGIRPYHLALEIAEKNSEKILIEVRNTLSKLIDSGEVTVQSNRGLVLSTDK